MDNFTKVIEVYKRDKKNPNKTYDIEFVAEYDISDIGIDELRNIILPSQDDENLFLMYTLDTSQIADIQKQTNTFFDIDNDTYMYMFTQYSL